ncbi:hypothetical protein NL676_004522 [Syzygium grande]|nr:hypothetical protein NL676_004522 [Syzygium grande]
MLQETIQCRIFPTNGVVQFKDLCFQHDVRKIFFHAAADAASDDSRSSFCPSFEETSHSDYDMGGTLEGSDDIDVDPAWKEH